MSNKKLVEHFPNKYTPTVTIKDKNNVSDTIHKKVVICENKDQSIFILKKSKELPNFDFKGYIKENTKSREYTNISIRTYDYYSSSKDDYQNIGHLSEDKVEKYLQTFPVLEQYMNRNVTICSTSVSPSAFLIALITCYDRV